MEIIKYIFFLFVFCLTPGYFLTSYLKFPLFSKERLVTSFATGMVFFTVISGLFYFLKLNNILLIFIIVLDLILLYHLYKESKNSKFTLDYKTNLVLMAIIAVGTVAFIPMYIRSGLTLHQKGMIIYTQIDNDAYWHLSIQNEIQKKFPPEHPGFSGTPLKNYHYLIDLFLSALTYTAKLNQLNVFFRYIPITFCIFYGLSIFILIKNITNNNILSFFSTAFAYLSGNASYLLPLLNKDSKGWGQGTFMLDQPFMLLSNLHTFAAVIIIISALIIYFSQSVKTKILLMSALIGLSGGFKIYPAIIIIAALGAVSIFRLITEKKSDTFFIAVLSSFFFIIATIPNMGGGGIPFIFAPGWILDTMGRDPDRVYLPKLVLAEAVYREHNNWIRIFQIRLIEFLIYLVGNLYIRIIGLGIGILEFFKKRRNTVILILGTASLLSLLFPVFFGQSGLIYNILQFGSLATIFTSILTPLIIRRKTSYLKIITMLILLFISLPLTAVNFIHYWNVRPSLIPSSNMEAINFMKNKGEKYDVILIYLSKSERNNLMISGLAGVQTFYSGEDYTEFGGKPVRQRKEEINKFFYPVNKISGLEYQRDFIKRHKIKTLYLTPKEQNIAENIFIPKKIIFKNSATIIYEFL